MIKKRPIYKVLATDTPKTRFDNIIYSDGSIETLCDKENKEEYEEENIIRINGFKKITQNGISLQLITNLLITKISRRF